MDTCKRFFEKQKKSDCLLRPLISEIRFWHNRKLAGTASARNEDLNIQNF